jgi:hypothetical protein
MTAAGDVRASIVDFLRREMVGPDPRPEHKELNQGEEILRPQDPPRLRYSTGVLFPKGFEVAMAENAKEDEVSLADSGPAEGEEPDDVTPASGIQEVDEANEHEVNRANDFMPSAMGLTALLRLPKRLRMTVKAGRYEKRTVEGVGRQDKDGRWQPHYWRRPIEDTVELDCESLLVDVPKVANPPLWIKTGDSNLRLELHVFSRPWRGAQNPARDRIVTFTLINRTSADSRGKDTASAFQCYFSVEAADGSKCFLEYPVRVAPSGDEEEASLRLLYDHRKTFAIGHGCAAWWPESSASAVEFIRTDCLPLYEIKPIVPREIPGLTLSMANLGREQDPAEVIQTCRALGQAYSAWINDRAAEISRDGFSADHKDAAERHLALCRGCHARIERGIEVLEADGQALKAFMWMNQAMLRQQLHYDLAANHRRTWENRGGSLAPSAAYARPNYESPPPGKGLWRPFQLAFILMNVEGIHNRAAEDRGTVDLIWFPTGGGKTEAYLGLTAMTIFARRLRNRLDAGTAVLMRYTLRLLTTQQFQRAASLICACDLIRQENLETLGEERISIGLWVGAGVTPNENAVAIKAHTKLLNEGKPNPFVVLTCPWCGVEMGPVKYGNAYRTPGYRREKSRVLLRCEDVACPFHSEDGLPLYVVDEDIYTLRPTLLIGTVDKFAMLPWVVPARRLFGLESAGSISPPDLIIQDELHLISGALGSMVGHYEATMDALCRHTVAGREVSAKIVASTATICRAPEQVLALYAKNVFLFPPQGLKAGDSFFAEEDGSAPGRLYMGVFGSALSSHVTAQVRVLSSLLQAAKCMRGSSAAELDPYWTLMVYFNSLRELGHAATMIRADIREYLNAMWDRLGIKKPAGGLGEPDLRRFINRDLELTSRIQSSEITEVLQSLFESYSDRLDGEGRALNRAVDVCLATNMIQVGLDVPRLGLMSVVGQPKTTSEYIQATSRVGRHISGPGLVVTTYNTAKPRDRSHYERFRSYHQSIYRWVEPTSVTPFAVPVRERALHAQIVTLARYWDPKLAESPKPPPSAELAARIRKVLVDRVAVVDGGEVAHTKSMIEGVIDRWRRLQPGIYGNFGSPPDETPLMYPSGSQPRLAWAGRAKATPSSMRNVDAGCDAGVISDFPKP